MRSPYTNKKGNAMYDTTIAAKLLGQLESFLGRISPHFHKPVARFIGDMVYGIMVETDVKLASIVRALKEKTTPKKVEDRLSRMLSSDGLEAGLHGVIASEGAKKVHKDTLIILGPSDVQKPYARKMEYLAKVWDGSKGEVGDNLEFYRHFLDKGLDFIVRLKERYVRSWKRNVMCGELAWQCRMLYREVVAFDHHGTEKRGVALRLLRHEHGMTNPSQRPISAPRHGTPTRS